MPKYISLLALLVCSTAIAASAQSQKRTPDQTWVLYGFGLSDRQGVAYVTGVTQQYGFAVFSIRGAGAASALHGSGSDLALLAGLDLLPRTKAVFSLAAGAALATGQDAGAFFTGGRSWFRPGLAAEVQFLPFPNGLFTYKGRQWGLGLYGFGNVNTRNTFYGLTLALQMKARRN